ncbi:MAG: glycosyltransferase family 4 protein [Alphaproteobacteria bacterium]
MRKRPRTRARIAFYAPLKAPTHKVASGDRTLARNIVSALTQAGYLVELASEFRSLDIRGVRTTQNELRADGLAIANRLIEAYLRRPARARPEIWFTYHLYHKAPDWIGPYVAAFLGIPYVVAEVSVVPRAAGGRWRAGYQAVLHALARADAVISFNRKDVPCVRASIGRNTAHVSMPPFAETAAFRAGGAARAAAQRQMRRRHAIPRERVLLLAVGMMREGDKFESYHVLAEALRKLRTADWHLLVAGDGPAANKTRRLFAGLEDRITYLGAVPHGRLARIYAAAEILVWPAVSEAFGMAFIEAQAAGLPCVAGRSGGVADIVRPGQGGFVVPEGDAAAFARAIDRLLRDPALRRRMGRAAARHARTRLDRTAAARRLAKILASLPAKH